MDAQGRLFVFGGANENNRSCYAESHVLGSCPAFRIKRLSPRFADCSDPDPSRGNNWEQCVPLPNLNCAFALASDEKQIVVLGGSSSPQNLREPSTNQVWVFKHPAPGSGAPFKWEVSASRLPSNNREA